MGMLMRRHKRQPVDTPVEAPEGTEEDLENQDPTGSASEGSEGQEDGKESSGEATPPARNASKADWLAFLGLDSDERTRDELAESVLGPKQ